MSFLSKAQVLDAASDAGATAGTTAGASAGSAAADAALTSLPAMETFTFTGTALVSTFSHTFTVVNPAKAPLIVARLRTVGTSISPITIADSGDMTFVSAPAAGIWDVTAIGMAL